MEDELSEDQGEISLHAFLDECDSMPFMQPAEASDDHSPASAPAVTLVFSYGSNGIVQLRDRCRNPDLQSSPAILPNFVRVFAGYSRRPRSIILAPS